jgi:hypothetical protein
METIKSTIQLVFLPGFRVAPICTYFNMLTLARLETRQKSGALLVDFKISMTLTRSSNFQGICPTPKLGKLTKT